MADIISSNLIESEAPLAGNENFLVGSSSVRDWECGRQDMHTWILSMKDDPTSSYFAVFDAHGGDAVAQYAAKHLHEIIVQQPDYVAKTDIEKALKQSFLDLDAEILHSESGGGDSFVGSTAVMVLFKDNKVYCANVGGSRAIASVEGHTELLSVEHNPTAEEPRVYRILGDFEVKLAHEKPVDELFTAYPNVETFDLTDNWEFVVIGCEGLWGVMEDTDVQQFCSHRIAQGMQPKEICDDLMNYCLSHDDSTHLTGDLTIILICFLNGKPYSDLGARCQLAVEDSVSDSVSDPVSDPVSDTASQLE